MQRPRTSEAPMSRLWARAWPAWAVQGGGVAMMLVGLALPWVMGWGGCVGFEERIVEEMVETGSSGDATTDETTGTDGTTGTPMGGTTVEAMTLVASTNGKTSQEGTRDEITGELPPEKKWKAGERIAAKTSLRPALVFIPGGSFQMGSPPTEAGRSEDELQHAARVGAFAMCNTEVTQAQYWAVMRTNPSLCDAYGEGCGGSFPVQNVSWNDACAYMNGLTTLENEVRERDGAPALTPCYENHGNAWVWLNRACTGFRLPTEAEWERAARAGKDAAYFFGNEAKDDHGDNVLGYYADYERVIRDMPGPIAKKTRNPWGLYDIYGNVWEWTWDRYGRYGSMNGANYAGPEVGLERVMRGGAFSDGARLLRSSARSWNAPTIKLKSIGFRCVRALGPV